MKRTTLLLLSLVAFSGVNAQDTWTQKASLAGPARWGATGFSIGTYGYITTGVGSSGQLSDLWQWNQATNQWTQKANIPIARQEASGFAIGNKGYVTCGYSTTNLNDLWEYDPATNQWTQKTSMPGTSRRFPVTFVIGTKGYVSTGNDNPSAPYADDLWEYDQATNQWSQKTNLPATGRSGAVAFAIGNKGYVGTGNDNSANFSANDFWEWDQATNTWTQKANVPGGERRVAGAFSIGGVGYVCAGWDGSTYFVDLWEYNPGANSWTARANFQGAGRYTPVTFSIGGYGYMGTGGTPNSTTDFWEYASLYVNIDEHKTEGTVSVFPNPFTTSCVITTGKTMQNATLSVFNLEGKCVKEITKLAGNSISLQREDLAAGSYIIRITEDKKTIAVEKMIIAD